LIETDPLPLLPRLMRDHACDSGSAVNAYQGRMICP
jgi:hypothetical protein